jgi:hypothetical protein
MSRTRGRGRASGAGRRLEELAETLRPDLTRPKAIAKLERMFQEGTVPDPMPAGFLRGRLIATTTNGFLDGVGAFVAARWMPWQGKTFDPVSMTGFNRFRPDARVPLRVVWPSYEPIRADGEGVEAFPFRNRVEPGAIDQDLKVLKIDYDFEANPRFPIRRILDELVQVDDGLYLGKVLLRWRGSFRRIGFFSLERP